MLHEFPTRHNTRRGQPHSGPLIFDLHHASRRPIHTRRKPLYRFISLHRRAGRDLDSSHHYDSHRDDDPMTMFMNDVEDIPTFDA